MRRKLQGSDEGDRQIVEVRSAVLTDGLAAVEAAGAEALTDGVHSAASFSISCRGAVTPGQRRRS